MKQQEDRPLELLRSIALPYRTLITADLQSNTSLRLSLIILCPTFSRNLWSWKACVPFSSRKAQIQIIIWKARFPVHTKYCLTFAHRPYSSQETPFNCAAAIQRGRATIRPHDAQCCADLLHYSPIHAHRNSQAHPSTLGQWPLRVLLQGKGLGLPCFRVQAAFHIDFHRHVPRWWCGRDQF